MIENNISFEKKKYESEKIVNKYAVDNFYLSIENQENEICKTENEKILLKYDSPKNLFMEYVFSNIPFTPSHLMMIFSVFFIRSIEGSEMIALSLGLETYKIMHNLTETQHEIMVFLILFGNFLGCLTCIFLGNKFPRKNLIRLGSVMIIVFGIISILTKNLYVFTISQNLVNMGIGILLANTTALITESFNMNYRGFILTLMLLSNSMGEIYISFCLDYALHADNHHLRNKYEISKLFFFVISPVILGFFLTFFYEESLYYHVEKRNIERVIEICNFYFENFEYSPDTIKKILCITNIEESNYSNNNNVSNLICYRCKKNRLFDNEKLEELRKESMKHRKKSKTIKKSNTEAYLKERNLDILDYKFNFENETKRLDDSSSISYCECKRNVKKSDSIICSLLEYKYVVLMFFFVFYSFSCQGLKYILPKTLDYIIKKYNPHGNQSSLNNTMKFSSILGGFTSIVTGILIENEHFQRLKLLKLLIWMSFICSVFVIFSESYFIVLLCIFKSVIIMLDQVLEVYASESISTKKRVFFLSILNILQSISIFTSAFVTEYFLKLDYKLNFVLFSGLLILMILISTAFHKEKYKCVVK